MRYRSSIRYTIANAAEPPPLLSDILYCCDPKWDTFCDNYRFKNYAGIYSGLKKLKEPLPEKIADFVLALALDTTAKSFAETLQHIEMTEYIRQKVLPPLLIRCIYLNRAEHLRLLLEQGADPNMTWEGCSALAIAAARGSLRCVELLLEDPRICPALDRDLLEVWGGVENGDVMLDFCIMTILPHVWTDAYDLLGPIPIPDALRLSDAILWENWPLAARLCKINAFDKKEAVQLLSEIPIDDPRLPEILDALFTAHPDLLRCRLPRQMLTAAALLPDEGLPPQLRPWLDRIRRKQIVLSPCTDRFSLPPLPAWDEGLFSQTTEAQPTREPAGRSFWRKILSRWKARLPDFLPPYLDRRSGLPALMDRDEAEALLGMCRVTGAVSPDQPSLLARQILICLSPELLCPALQEEGFLQKEPTRGLLDYCRTLIRESEAPARALLHNDPAPQLDVRMIFLPSDPIRQYKRKLSLLAGMTKLEDKYDL